MEMMPFCLEPIVNIDVEKPIAYEVLFRGIANGISRERLFLSLKEDLDFEIFSQAVEFVCRMLEEGTLPSPPRLFINIKPATLVKYDIQIIDAISKLPLPVVLELREDVLEEEQAKEIRKMKGYLRFSLDDFGKGGSNIDRLVLLEPDFVKLDFEVLRTIPANALLLLVESLKKVDSFHLIAEKVETKQDLQKSRMAGIKLGQGWFWKAPLKG